MGDFEHGAFEHKDTFAAAAETTALALDRYETYYQELFSEALEDGVITADERTRLEQAAERLGIDQRRLGSLEQALRASYETHHGHGVLDTSRMFGPRDTVQAPAPDFVPSVEPPPMPKFDTGSDEVLQLRARVAFLEERARELEAQLDEARAQVAYEVDFSDLDAPVPSVALDQPEALHRRLRHDPRDTTTLKSLYFAHMGNVDRQWCVAHALGFLGAADADQQALDQTHRVDGLIQPQAAIDAGMWRRLLCHPDDEALTSDILSVIVSAVLLAHSAALKGAGRLPKLDPERRLDPATSTVQAARCFAWAAQTLGMSAPPLYANPDAAEVIVQMVPTVPPVCSLGKRALSGRSAGELAFIAARELAYYRPERFIRLLVPDIVDLQDLFLAALAIGNPKLPLNAAVRSRVEPISKAIEPLLEAREIDALRSAYQRFVEHGGIANLQRWGAAADLTAARAGLLLCGDLGVAAQVLGYSGTSNDETIDDLLVFLTSDRYGALREHMGIAIRG